MRLRDAPYTTRHRPEGEGFDSSAYLLRGVGRYFFSDDCKLELEVDYIAGKGVTHLRYPVRKDARM